MLDIEKIKKTLQTMTQISLYIHEIAPQYKINFLDSYSDKYFFGYDPNPFYDQTDNSGVIIMCDLPGDFFTPLGYFKLFGSMSYRGCDELPFVNHIKEKFGIIELKPANRYGYEALYAFSKDIEGNLLPTPNSENYQNHLLEYSDYLSYEESNDIWTKLKPQIVDEMFLHHPGVLNPKENQKPEFVLKNKDLSTLWDKAIIVKQIQMQTGLTEKGAKKIYSQCSKGDTLSNKALEAWISNFFKPMPSETRKSEIEDNKIFSRP